MIKFDPKTFDPGEPGTIYTLDIETTSLFQFPDGEWKPFDYSKPPAFYQGMNKAGVPYIWMFGVNDTVYYGRDFMQLEDVLNLIADGSKKFVYVHNLSFEFQWLMDIFEHYTISNMIARSVRKPIAFTVDELNIQFRCSYMLTNLSLEKSAERYTDLRKKTGDLDYNKARHSRTELTELELSYCEYDILTLYKIVCYFRDKYGGYLSRIPYTATGEIRKAFRKTVSYGYVMRVAKSTPSPLEYLEYVKTFTGGMTHGSAIWIGDILKGICSYDIASSYPYVMLLPIFPQGRFRKCSPEKANKLNRNKWSVLYHVKMHKVEAAKLNHYILLHKVVHASGVVGDNGRLVSADMVEMYLTEIDFDIITKDAYQVGRIEYLDTKCAVKGYLPEELIRFVLTTYSDKTKLKGVKGKEDFYQAQKAKLNGLFGCCVTNILKSGADFQDGQWVSPELTMEYVTEKVEGLKNSKSNCFQYIHGIYITAAARGRLWKIISNYDTDVVYYDTDSIKGFKSEELDLIIQKENDIVRRNLQQTSNDFDIPFEMFEPADIKGKKHLIGLWEYEGEYAEFVTLGAKRYAYKDMEGNLHCTVSGVNNKTGYKALNGSLKNFTDGLVFEYETANKLTSVYIDDQEPFFFRDYQGKIFKATQKHSIVLQPAEYSLEVSEEFDAFVEEQHNAFKEGAGAWIK